MILLRVLGRDWGIFKYPPPKSFFGCRNCSLQRRSIIWERDALFGSGLYLEVLTSYTASHLQHHGRDPHRSRTWWSRGALPPLNVRKLYHLPPPGEELLPTLVVTQSPSPLGVPKAQTKPKPPARLLGGGGFNTITPLINPSGCRPGS